MDEALGRDLALALFTLAAGKVADRQPFAPEQRRTDFLEVFQRDAALADADDQHPAADLFGGVVGGAEQAVEPLGEGLDVGRQQPARVEVGEEVLHREESVDFLVGEPHAGEFGLGRFRA